MNQECFQELVKFEMAIKYPGLKLGGEVNTGDIDVRGSKYTWYLNVVNDIAQKQLQIQKRRGLKIEL